MNFPIFATITKPNATFPTATLLKIDGNSGGIPNSFQSNLFADGVLLNQPNVPMTKVQWSAWLDQEDEDYILQCVSENLGIQVQPPSADNPVKPSAVKRRNKSR